MMFRIFVPVMTLLLVFILFGGGYLVSWLEPAAPADVSAQIISGDPSARQPLQTVKILLKWIPQTQFAGIYAARDKGFFRDEGIEAEIVPGGPDIIVEKEVSQGRADLGITDVGSLLVHREKGLNLVSIAQILQKSSLMLLTKASSGIDAPAKLKDQQIGVFTGSSQYPAIAFFDKYGLYPDGIRMVDQGETMEPFLRNQLNVVSASSYNEVLTVLENGFTPKQLHVFGMEAEGVGMLEDTVIAKTRWIDRHRNLAVGAVRAILRGWRYALEHQEEAVDMVMRDVPQGSTTRAHQAAMLKEIAKLIVPPGTTVQEVGAMREPAFAKTADIAYKYGLISQPADVKQIYDDSIYDEANK